MIPTDLSWLIVLIYGLLMAPVYQLLGTIKHELAHALMIWFHGHEVLDIYILPKKIDGQWYWGYTQWNTPLTLMSTIEKKLIYGAPYLVDLAMIGLGFWLIPKVVWHVELWTMSVMLFWIASIVDIGWAIYKKIVGMRGDFDVLFK